VAGRGHTEYPEGQGEKAVMTVKLPMNEWKEISRRQANRKQRMRKQTLDGDEDGLTHAVCARVASVACVPSFVRATIDGAD